MSANIDILYEDNHLLVLNKPAGVPSQGDLTNDPSALDLAKDYIKHKYNKPGNVYAGLAHRIDRPVSGTLLVCKTSKSLSRMMEQFRNRKVRKSYIAIVDNRVSWKQKHLSDYLMKDRKRNIARVVSASTRNAKHAELDAEVGFRFGGFTLLNIFPLTGRSHQIRVQLSNIGLPIVGDVKYGGSKHSEKRAICLHSHKLTVFHPVTGEEMTFSSLPYQHHWLDYGQLLARVVT